MSHDEISLDEIPLNGMSLDKMSTNETFSDKIIVVDMSVDIMSAERWNACRRNDYRWNYCIQYGIAVTCSKFFIVLARQRERLFNEKRQWLIFYQILNKSETDTKMKELNAYLWPKLQFTSTWMIISGCH